jgi:toxin CcdB
MSVQFDVHSNVFADSDVDPPLLVNLQSDHLGNLRTAIVAPMWPTDDGRPAPPVRVAVRFERRNYWLAVNELAFVRVNSLGPIMGNIASERDRIIRGLDLLFTGV